MSEAGFIELARRKSVPRETLTEIDRTDPHLVAMMREDTTLYGGKCAHISIVNVPDGTAWEIRSRGAAERVVALGS